MKKITLTIVAFLSLTLNGLAQAAESLESLGISSEEQNHISQQITKSSNQLFGGGSGGDLNDEQQAYIKASNTDIDDLFGKAVALSGNTLVVGVPEEGSDGSAQTNNSFDRAGAVYVFVRNNGIWQHQAYLKAENVGEFDQFGGSVAISGDTIVVGAFREGGDASSMVGAYNDNAFAAGAAYVFVRNGTDWTQQAYLKPNNIDIGDFFGFSVDISGDTIIVGARGEDSNATGVNQDDTNNDANGSGAAYVFARSGTIWTQQAYLKASNAQELDLFGQSVSISKNTIVVGAAFEDGDDNGTEDDSGAVYVFQSMGSTWSQQALLKADNAGENDQFGDPIAIWNNTIVVGVENEDSSTTGIDFIDDDLGNTRGAVYVYNRDGSSWSQQARIKPDIIDNFDHFGASVAVSDGVIVVGAYNESSSATGVNGDADNNDAGSSGAAYVFSPINGTWQQYSYLKASNSDTNTRTGTSVAIDNNMVATGGIGDASNATGIDGDQSNTDADFSGAVYVFSTTADVLFTDGFE